MKMEIKHKGEEYQVIYDDEMNELISRYKWHIGKGYARTSLPKDENGNRSSLSMHRVILNHTAEHTHHINGNRLDNRLTNLKPLTAKEHLGAMHAHKGNHTKHTTWTKRTNFTEKEISTRFKPGCYSASTKLTKENVIEMRGLHQKGISTTRLAKLFKIGKSAAWEAVSGKSFKTFTQ